MPPSNQTLTAPSENAITRLLKILVLTTASAFIAVYPLIATNRIGYPFELEWIEGASVDSVRRLLAAEPLYVAPSPQFAPFMYPPLYFWISAIVAKLTGVGFLPLRLVSLLSSLASLRLIYSLVRNETASALPAITAAGLYAATYQISGAWFDIARIDSLFLLLVLASIHFLRKPANLSNYAFLSAVLMFFAYFTKQAALPVFIPIMLGLTLHERRKAIRVLPVALGLIILTTVAYAIISRGWYFYYVFELPRHHPIRSDVYLTFWTLDLLKPVPVMTLISVLYLAITRLRRNRYAYLYFYAAAGMIAASYLLRLHYGGYANVLFPAYAILAILAGLGLHQMFAWSQTHPVTAIRSSVPAVSLLLVLGQFSLLAYNPWKHIPTARDQAEGQKLIDKLRQLPGEIYMPGTGYLPALAGKQTSIHMSILADIILRGQRDHVREMLTREIAGSLRSGRYSTVITPDGDYQNGKSNFLELFGDDINAHYEYGGQIITGAHLMPVTGVRLRPKHVWVFRKSKQ